MKAVGLGTASSGIPFLQMMSVEKQACQGVRKERKEGRRTGGSRHTLFDTTIHSNQICISGTLRDYQKTVV
jgi:hypothetical protein